MTQPGNHRSLGSLLDRDSLGAGHGAGPNRRGVIGDCTGQPLGEISVIFMKAEKRYNGPEEIFNVLGLGLASAAGIGLSRFV